jgi:ribonuclease-3
MDDTREKETKEFLNTNFSFGTEKIELYNEALTHSSNGLPNNQRLAFLGDSVLRLIIREHYFRGHPDWDKGRLTKECGETIEPNKNFANIASNLEIVKYIKFGKTYDNRIDDVKENTTIKAEAFEALFGAIYLDQGLDKAKEIAKKLKII